MGNARNIVVLAVVVAAVCAAGFSCSRKNAAAPVPEQRHFFYKNRQYGFGIVLPAGWKGTKVVSGGWSGFAVTDNDRIETGPKFRIRHPLWTREAPREDIPVLVFTPGQWARVLQEALSISAAPYPPALLGQNSRYVFALPARYNFDYLTGFEEVGRIIRNKLDFKVFEPST